MLFAAKPFCAHKPFFQKMDWLRYPTPLQHSSIFTARSSKR